MWSGPWRSPWVSGPRPGPANLHRNFRKAVMDERLLKVAKARFFLALAYCLFRYGRKQATGGREKLQGSGNRRPGGPGRRQPGWSGGRNQPERRQREQSGGWKQPGKRRQPEWPGVRENMLYVPQNGKQGRQHGHHAGRRESVQCLSAAGL